MKFYIQYKGEDEWHEIERDVALQRLGAAYREESVLPMLEEGQTLMTSFAFYKLEK